ncbi:MAG: ABC transporter ATP-binding protein [Acidimicrobiia bacterium]|nr:ABC transporter ATP-binding protein [Acidimicrobiia bacterium]NNL28040.1 ABC transporter ATP-binding protein [Acidimicrobiia bacterium]
MASALLDFRDVHLSFAGVKALDGVSFHVDEGELFAIIGPNGAGKTSIFNCLNGVYEPQSGEILWEGSDIIGRKPYHIAEDGISRTFQNIELFGAMTVLQNLMLGRHHKMTSSWAAASVWMGRARREELENRERVEEIIDFLEIEQYRQFPVALLPYGVQKRIELGRALAMEPKLLLLDEPVAGMNLEETEDMARFILDIQEELGIAMILVEHDMGLVMDIAQRVMVLDFGRNISTGTPAFIQNDPEVIRAYLGEEFESEELIEAETQALKPVTDTQ